MKNETLIEYFYILPFSGETRSKPFITAFFFLIYVVGVLINSSIITVICLEVQLHKPMYLFICNLSIVDIFYTSVTVPKLLHMLLSGNHIVSSAQCYTQFYFFIVNLSMEDILLFVMACDRYVAICKPLHYHQILSRRNCSLITIGIWVVAFSNALLFMTSALYMTSCHSNLIHQFFCDIKSLTKTSCRRVTGYIIPDYAEVLSSMFHVIYTTITPMINPIIYSIQNSSVQAALLRLFRRMY
ncbi:hypothetical protein GDO81_019859 [Engystomops pustulosus]|uniref:G-protein coupled receptors family 1 profile domain-containing protein n=1 Tax=Engystomops pustulosus TaxID=76066 RepID=A0AAV6ZKN3_ENGPU|nr:hypothetical protein GDO81_019859 [Engystomops pustulosus]